MRKETGQDIVIDLGECDIVQVEPDDEVSTALPVAGDEDVAMEAGKRRHGEISDGARMWEFGVAFDAPPERIRFVYAMDFSQ